MNLDEEDHLLKKKRKEGITFNKRKEGITFNKRKEGITCHRRKVQREIIKN
jgi:hypothetical protein